MVFHSWEEKTRFPVSSVRLPHFCGDLHWISLASSLYPFIEMNLSVRKSFTFSWNLVDFFVAFNAHPCWRMWRSSLAVGKSSLAEVDACVPCIVCKSPTLTAHFLRITSKEDSFSCSVEWIPVCIWSRTSWYMFWMLKHNPATHNRTETNICQKMILQSS